MVPKFRAIVLTLVAIVVVENAMANGGFWGLTGHRVVGEIAEKYLTKKTRRALREILGDESLAMASNWADFIKSDTSFNYLNPWHYINLKGGLSQEAVYSILRPDTGVNLYAKLNFIVRELKNKELETDKKLLYLRLLIHMVGDLHQPLHVGGRPEDLGGNRIRVVWFGDSTNLHSVWDERIIDFQKLSYSEWSQALDHTSKSQRATWQQQPLMEWFYESYQLAQGIYSGITFPNQRLTFRYNFDNIDTVNQQLLKGGVRLAGLLNEIFGS